MTEEKEFTICLTELEMRAVVSCMTNLFNRLARDKQSPPPEIAERVMSALNKMKVASEVSSIIKVAP